MKQFVITTTILILLIATACNLVSPSGTPTPTLAPNMGRVVGVLQVRSGETTIPVKNAILYLAKTLTDTAGNESVAAMDPVNSPNTATDDNGRFMFPNVSPGNYGVVLFNVTSSYMLNNPDTGDSMLVTVTVNSETDLGTLVYSSLPTQFQPKPYP